MTAWSLAPMDIPKPCLTLEMLCLCLLQLLLVCESFFLKHAQLSWDQLYDLTTKEYYLFALGSSWIAVTVCLSYPSAMCHSVYCSGFGWIWADSLALHMSEFILLLISAVTLSMNIREPNPLAAIHAHTTTLPLMSERWCGQPSHNFLLPSFW